MQNRGIGYTTTNKIHFTFKMSPVFDGERNKRFRPFLDKLKGFRINDVKDALQAHENISS